MKNVYDMETLAASHRADLLHEARQAALARLASAPHSERSFSLRRLVVRLLRLQPAKTARTPSRIDVAGSTR